MVVSHLTLCLLQIFNLKNKPAHEGEDGDLSDSEDSVYSGLEDSGSDSDDDDDEDEVMLDSEQTQQVEFNQDS